MEIYLTYFICACLNSSENFPCYPQEIIIVRVRMCQLMEECKMCFSDHVLRRGFNHLIGNDMLTKFLDDHKIRQHGPHFILLVVVFVYVFIAIGC
jgi:hypothetical protein